MIRKRDGDASQPASGRVSLRVAVPVVLACGALGYGISLVAPLSSFAPAKPQAGLALESPAAPAAAAGAEPKAAAPGTLAAAPGTTVPAPAATTTRHVREVPEAARPAGALRTGAIDDRPEPSRQAGPATPSSVAAGEAGGDDQQAREVKRAGKRTAKKPRRYYRRPQPTQQATTPLLPFLPLFY